MNYIPPSEPVIDQQGYEGCVKWENTLALRAFLIDYKYTRDATALEMAKKIGRFCLKPSMWEDSNEFGYPGNEHGCWGGHFHGSMGTLQGLLDLAIADHCEPLKQVVREAYDQARREGVIRMGWFPGWTTPEKYKRPAVYHGLNETCGVADFVILAVKLSDAGLGDYWDDIDGAVRNHLTEQQFTDANLMAKYKWNDSSDNPANFVGGFGMGAPTSVKPTIYNCCSANGAISLYYAWHGITRFDNGVATVNLLLNRASAWMDIDSYLPYEGKVVLHNKQAHTIIVRIPYWANLSDVTCSVGQNKTAFQKSGSRIIITGIKPNDDITIKFSLHKTEERYFIHDKTYTVKFKGSTVVDITPRDEDAAMYPLYKRDNMMSDKTPIHNITRFVPSKLVPLQ